MLFKALIFITILSVWTFAQAQRGKTTSQPDRSSIARTCGAPDVRDQPKYFDNFGKHWLDQDARYVITDPERAAFKSLSNDEERDTFIEYFWYRHDPTPDTIENEFKDEHYRRILYANQHFAWRLPGWRTDRGRMYIMYDRPDSIELTTLGALKENDGGKLGETFSAPVEVWHYRYLAGIGQEVNLEFVDLCHCGDFHMRIPENDSLGFFINGVCSPGSAKHCSDREQLNEHPDPVFPRPSEQLVMPPQMRFKDLEEIVTAKVRYSLLRFGVQTSAVRATESTDWVSLTLQFQNHDLSWKKNDEKPSVNLHVYARFTTLTGRIAQTIEDEIKQSDEHETGTQDSTDGLIQFSRSVALPAGRYRLDVVVQDVNADKAGTWSKGVIVPAFSAGELETSPLILADQVDAPGPHYARPTSGELYIGDVQIHPRLGQSSDALAVFHPGEQLGLFLQAYNLSVSPGTSKSDAVITYKIVDAATRRIAIETKETNLDLRQVAEQITIEKSIPLATIPKGQYHICVKVDDRIARRSSTAAAQFAIQ